jgi:hypothetical protein
MFRLDVPDFSSFFSAPGPAGGGVAFDAPAATISGRPLRFSDCRTEHDRERLADLIADTESEV